MLNTGDNEMNRTDAELEYDQETWALQAEARRDELVEYATDLLYGAGAQSEIDARGNYCMGAPDGIRVEVRS